jgi:type IV secretory pathway VirB10-like protein
MTRARPSEPGPEPSASPVFADPVRHLPRVGRKDPVWRFALGCLGVGCFAAVVFLNLSQGRLQSAQAQDGRRQLRSQALPPSPQPAQAAAQPAPGAPASSPPPATAGGPDAGAGAPALLVDNSDQLPLGSPADGQAARPVAGAATAGPADAKASPEERFSDRLSTSAVETVHATRLRDTALIAPQGTVISAILETALNSDLPGFARAIVTRDVRGYDNSTVLIPKGSKLVGQYKSAVSAGQSRAFVVWTRLLTPEGVSIDLGSPGADELGRAGLAGETNSHFLRRFGSSILLSVITAGLTAASESGDRGGTAIVVGAPAGVANPATVALSKDIDIPDTISVKQGAAIRVFVAKDLDFSAVMGRRPE